jgi:hypothetical protein
MLQEPLREEDERDAMRGCGSELHQTRERVGTRPATAGCSSISTTTLGFSWYSAPEVSTLFVMVSSFYLWPYFCSSIADSVLSFKRDKDFSRSRLRGEDRGLLPWTPPAQRYEKIEHVCSNLDLGLADPNTYITKATVIEENNPSRHSGPAPGIGSWSSES